MGYGVIAIIVGFLAFAFGLVGLIVRAWQESPTQGKLCWLVPFYFVYYGFSHRREVLKPFVLSLAGVVIGLAGFGLLFVGFNSDVKPVITRFMKAGAAGNTDQAYALFPAGAVDGKEITEFIQRNRQIFEGFEGVTLRRLEITLSSGQRFGYVAGYIRYAGGRSVPLEAVLVKEDGTWKLYRINLGN